MLFMLVVSGGTSVAAPGLDEPPSPPSATVPLAAPLAAPPPSLSHHDRCDTSGYIEPALLAGATTAGSAAILNRVAAGVLVRDCDEDGTAATHVRIGGTLVLSNLAFGGAGIEAEVDHPIVHDWRVGARISLESTGFGRLYSFGARVHASDTLFLEVDVIHAIDTRDASAATTTAVLGGIGLEGKGGRYLGIAEFVAVGLLTAAALSGGVGH